jgi:hypothetical protein
MDILIRYAHRDTWRETVIMAAGHANEPLRRELLSGILSRARSESRRARTLKLVAVACLETLPSIPDDLREDLDQCLDDLIPPRDEASARSLATAGEPVLARLPNTLESLTEAAACATVRTAWLINGPHALDALARYASDVRPEVRDQVAAAWSYFDAEEFAHRVLANAPAGGTLTLTHAPHHVRALSRVQPLSDLFVRMDDIEDFDFLTRHAKTLIYLGLRAKRSMPDPTLLPPLPALRALTLGHPSLGALAFLDGLPRLEELWLWGSEMITDYSPLRRQTEVTTLWLDGCAHLTSLPLLPAPERLLTLGINDSRLDDGLDRISRAAPRLTMLGVNRCAWVADLRPLSVLPLQGLYIADCENVTDFQPLSSVTGLRFLNLSRTRIEDLRPLRGLSELRELWLNGCTHLGDLSPLGSLPNLRRLDLVGAAPGLDLEPLAANRKLTVTVEAGQDVRGAEALGRRVKVH